MFPVLSRRNFFKASCGIAGLTLLKPSTSVASPAALPQDQAEKSYSICNFCSSLCNIEVTTRTIAGVKRVVKLDGNPHSTLNRGKICARGQSGLRQTYDTDRFKQPLIRVEGSQRGEMKFRAVSWQEAWEYIATRQKHAQIKPWEWTMIGGWTSCVFYMNWSVPFALANEIPNIVASPMQHCVATGHFGTDSLTGNFNIHDEVLPDYDHAKYILLIGNNASMGAVSTCRVVRFATALKNGAKVVAVDPRLSETAAKAHEWLAIRPGTDLEFSLALLKEMLDHGYYDSEFLRTYTNLPFLVYQDAQGQWQLARDAEKRPLAAEEGTNHIRTLPAYTNKNTRDVEGQPFYPALVAEDLVWEGRPVVTVFQAQQAEIKDCTPEWAEKITTIPAATIRRIAYEFGTTRPAIIDPGWHGARYGNIMMTRRVQAMIQTLNGGIDQEGGWVMSGEFHHKLEGFQHAKAHGEQLPAPMETLPGIEFVNMLVNALSKGENFSHGHPGWGWAYAAQQKAAGQPWVAVPAIADEGMKESIEGKLLWRGEKYQTRALFINAANPVRHYYSDAHWKEMMRHPNMELIICLEVLPSDTTPYVDVILPSSTYLERSEPNIYGNGVNSDLAVTTRYAAIEPLYDSAEAPDVLLELTRIISGAPERLFQAMERLTRLPAAAVQDALEKQRQAGHKAPFSRACREISFQVTAQRLGTTVENLDKILREKGVYPEAHWRDLLKTAGVPRKLPTTTPSGRLEFFSSIFEGLRMQGATGPHFNVLAGYFPAQCRADKSMDEPLAADEFYFTYGKTTTVSYGSTNSNNPVIAAINTLKKDLYTGVWIHPQRAAQLQIRHGDAIILTNTLSGQTAAGRAYLTRQIRPDTLFIHSSFGIENPQLTRSFGMGGTATNKLIPHIVEPVVAGFRSQEFTLRIAKA